MLNEIGVSSIEELFSDIPEHLRLSKPLKLPPSSTEWELSSSVEEILNKNKTYPEFPCFLGGGIAPHYVPAAVDAITSRSEFYTAYTPYQPEISQGMLQTLFEYQSLICDITGMDAANCSMYDWASALGEAARMAARVKRKRNIVVSASCGPERLDVLRTYCKPAGIEVKVADFDWQTGETSTEKILDVFDGNTAAVYIENPNFFGIIETQAASLAEEIHSRDALMIAGIDPISLGVLKSPGDYGADIVVGDGQSTGLHMNFGGPTIGVFAARGDLSFLREMPGRIIGLTSTQESGQRGFSMILQTREQHIRREGATSNICTNQSLLAVSVAAYLSLIGGEGLRKIGAKILSNSHLAAEQIASLDEVKSPLFTGAFFKEFVVGILGKKEKQRTMTDLHLRLGRRGIHAAYPLGQYFEGLKDSALFCVTEIHKREEIKQLVLALSSELRDQDV